MSIESSRREQLWEQLLSINQATRIPPSKLRELGVYGGAAGIWMDSQRTQSFSSNDYAIAVSVLHTGNSYPDDLLDDGIIYHYPTTQRHPSFDNNEIEATKNCKRFNLPLFVISHSKDNNSYRDVKLGWVEMWEDSAREFLITFSEEQPAQQIPNEDDNTFDAFDNSRGRRQTNVRVRTNPGRFRLGVFRRYGCQCAICDINNPKLLDAAHIIDSGMNGTDDFRNGIVLCKNHHAAFDKKLFKINPNTYEIVYDNENAESLKITKNNIGHLNPKPHPLALEWRWERE